MRDGTDQEEGVGGESVGKDGQVEHLAEPKERGQDRDDDATNKEDVH